MSYVINFLISLSLLSFFYLLDPDYSFFSNFFLNNLQNSEILLIFAQRKVM